MVQDVAHSHYSQYDPGPPTFSQLSNNRPMFNINMLCTIATIQENVCKGPFYWHGLTLIKALVSNHTRSKVWDETTYQFPNFKDYTVEMDK